MRWRADGSLVFYMPKGQRKRGVPNSELVTELRSMVEEVFSISVESRGEF